jgi:hypothetical protein
MSMPAPTLSADPLRYEPAVESFEEDEAETTRQLDEALRHIADTVFRHEGHAHRSVHAKSHALVQGELSVPDDLPPTLAQGLFATPGRYPAVLRFSSTPGDLLEDAVSTPRGLALKLLGVSGERLPGSEGATTQDLVMVNGPVFSAPSARRFLKTLKLLAATTDKAPGLKKALSAALRGLETLVEAAGGESATLKALGGHPATHPLGERYFTQVPMLHGPYMAKYTLEPESEELLALVDRPIELTGHPDALRDAMRAHFASQGGRWALKAQLCTDLETMPIEDPTVPWPEESSPWRTVATLEVPPQTAWSEARSRAVDDGMAFSPWHGLAAHRPIGSIMRVRRAVYEQSARLRSHRNASPLVEPEPGWSMPD